MTGLRADSLALLLWLPMIPLAESAGAVYTRYADDLAFSGDADFDRRAERFSVHAAAVLAEEGFSVHHRKTRIMRQGVRQYLAGIVTNERVNVVRADYDRLKAILTNCARRGPESQNREGHEDFRAHRVAWKYCAGRVWLLELRFRASTGILRRRRIA